MNRLHSFQFACPTRILCGAGALNQLPTELAWLGSRMPMVFCHEESGANGALQGLTAGFENSGLRLQVCDQVPKDPSDTDMEDLANLAARSGCDSIIALGSGIPAAVGFRASGMMTSSADPSGGRRPPAPPWILVPGVIGNRARDFPEMGTAERSTPPAGTPMPALAVVDVRTLPAGSVQETAGMALAVMARAAKALVSDRQHALSRVYARAAVQCAAGAMPAAIDHPRDLNARLALVAASVMTCCGRHPGHFQPWDWLADALSAETQLDAGIAQTALALALMPRTDTVATASAADLLLSLVGPDNYAACPEVDRGALAVHTLYHLLGPAMTAVTADWRQEISLALGDDFHGRIAGRAASASNGRLTEIDGTALLMETARFWTRGNP